MWGFLDQNEKDNGENNAESSSSSSKWGFADIASKALSAAKATSASLAKDLTEFSAALADESKGWKDDLGRTEKGDGPEINQAAEGQQSKPEPAESKPQSAESKQPAESKPQPAASSEESKPSQTTVSQPQTSEQPQEKSAAQKPTVRSQKGADKTRPAAAPKEDTRPAPQKEETHAQSGWESQLEEVGEGVQVHMEKLASGVSSFTSNVWGKMPSLLGGILPTKEPQTVSALPSTTSVSRPGAVSALNFQSQLSTIEESEATYCTNPTAPGFDAFQRDFEEKYSSFWKREILAHKAKPTVGAMFHRLVGGGIVEEKVFWCRFLFARTELIDREHKRQALVSRLESTQDNLTWDDDEDVPRQPTSSTTTTTSVTIPAATATSTGNTITTTTSKPVTTTTTTTASTTTKTSNTTKPSATVAPKKADSVLPQPSPPTTVSVDLVKPKSTSEVDPLERNKPVQTKGSEELEGEGDGSTGQGSPWVHLSPTAQSAQGFEFVSKPELGKGLLLEPTVKQASEITRKDSNNTSSKPPNNLQAKTNPASRQAPLVQTTVSTASNPSKPSASMPVTASPAKVHTVTAQAPAAAKLQPAPAPAKPAPVAPAPAATKPQPAPAATKPQPAASTKPQPAPTTTAKPQPAPDATKPQPNATTTTKPQVKPQPSTVKPPAPAKAADEDWDKWD